MQKKGLWIAWIACVICFARCITARAISTPIETKAIESTSVLTFSPERVEAASGAGLVTGSLLGSVVETFKGPKAERVRLELGPLLLDKEAAEALAVHHSTLMIFSRSGTEAHVDVDGRMTLFPYAPTWVILSNEEPWWDSDVKDHVAVDVHFRPVVGEAAINCVRQTLARRDARVIAIAGAGAPIQVPDDGNLPALAMEWAGSGDWEVRALAAGAIAMFPATPKSTGTLHRLLQDPYVADVEWAGLSPWSEKAYPVRAAAWDAVSTLGLQHELPAPKLSEDPGLYKRISKWWLAAPVMVGLLVIVERRVARKWLRMPAPSILNRIMITPVVLSGLLCVFNAGMWARSYWTADDYVFSHSGHFYNVTSFKGGWRLEIAYRFPPEKPLVHYAMVPDHVGGDMILPGDRFFRNRFGSAIGYAPEDRTAVFSVDTHWKDEDELPELTVPGAFRGDVPPLDAMLLVLPHRYVMAATAPLPLAYLAAVGLVWWRRRHRARGGCCRRCGFDMRVQLSGNEAAVCPECGEAWTGPRKTPKVCPVAGR